MAAIQLRTSVPGPNSKKLIKQHNTAVSKGAAFHAPIFIKSAKGAILQDVDNNFFIDFAGGVGACNVGHSNPAVASAIKKQLEKFFHTCYTLAPYEQFVKLCTTLNKLAGTNHKSVLFNSGAEAIENAVKLARHATNRPAVVSFEHGFHGRTLLTMSLTSKIHPYKYGFGPFAPETYKLEYPYLYRRPRGINEEDYINSLLDHIEGPFFKGVVDPSKIACIVMELVTGEGGFIIAPKNYVKQLRKITKREGILLIIDEVQTGFCRTGKMFSYQHYGIEPDIIAVAKSMSAGLPLSGIIGRKSIMDNIQPGGFGGTFSGNPISCSAALASIEYMKKKNLALKARHIGNIVIKKFQEFHEKYSLVGDVRGLGAMCGIELVTNRSSKKPAPEAVNRLIKYSYEHGLLLLETGIFGNVIRTLMPLVITDSQLNEGLSVFESSLANAQKRT